MRYVFIKPLRLETLEARLRSRGTEKDTEVQTRLKQAEIELEYANIPGVHDKVIVNDDLEKAFEQLDESVYLNKSSAYDKLSFAIRSPSPNLPLQALLRPHRYSVAFQTRVTK